MKNRKIKFDRENAIREFWEEGGKIEDQDIAVRKSIQKAVGDVMARTLTKKFGVTDNLYDHLVEGKDNLVARIKIYMDNHVCQNQEAFDEWHHKTCDWILDRINEVYSNAHYGKAQKVLNMTFKYLYCSGYGWNKEEHFKFCHMPLDSYTLEWVFRNVYPLACELGEGKVPAKTKTPPWSNFTYDGDYSYRFVTNLITRYFQEYKTGTTALQAEFVIWKEIQLELAAENFYAQLLEYMNEKTQKKEKVLGFKGLSLQKKLEEVQCQLKRYQPE